MARSTRLPNRTECSFHCVKTVTCHCRQSGCCHGEFHVFGFKAVHVGPDFGLCAGAFTRTVSAFDPICVVGHICQGRKVRSRDGSYFGVDMSSVVERLVREALQDGGLLAVAASRPSVGMTRRLQRAGFEVAEFLVPASANAKKPRLQPVWLARKGKPAA